MGVTDGGTEVASSAPKETTLSYEQARDKLAAVVKRLETGGLTLEQSLELWERGERLAAAMATRDDADPAKGADDAPF